MGELPPVPSKIGPYLIKNEIGRGAFAVVRLGVHSETKQQYAVKIITKKSVEEKDVFTHFETEVRVLHQMRHPHIVQFLDILKDDYYYYLFMDYCPNGELFTYIIDHRFLQEDEAKILMRQICSGLKYIHSISAAHRDLKPENLLIDEYDQIKISDFGFARYVPSNNLVSTACGSKGYAAPECFSGKPYNPYKSDMWSLGIILFAMVTGQLPWTQKNDVALIEQIKQADYKMPTYLSQSCQDLLRKLINPNPDDRVTSEEIFDQEWMKIDDNILYTKEINPGISLKYLDSFFNRETSDLKIRRSLFPTDSCRYKIDKLKLYLDFDLESEKLPALFPENGKRKGPIPASEQIKMQKIQMAAQRTKPVPTPKRNKNMASFSRVPSQKAPTMAVNHEHRSSTLPRLKR